MVGKEEEVDPSDIGKHPKLIRAAQKDIAQMDVLVCGKCMNVFHLIELFKEHKDKGCSEESPFRECRDTKSKVWAFLLWKASQLCNNNLSNNFNMWKLYQTWIKMDESIRETWVVAGRTIQSFAKMGQGTLQEMPVKITKTVVDNVPAKANQIQQPSVVMKKTLQTNSPIKEVHKDDPDDPMPIKVIEQQGKSRKVTPNPVNQSSSKLMPTTAYFARNINRRANRTIPNSNGQEVEEEIVEKIIAKRFNPRRKMHEFLVKWEGYPHDQNTWEPQIHLECCPQLLDTFEKQLARQKEQKAKQASIQQQQQQQSQQQQQQQQSATSSTSISSGNKTTRTIISKARVVEQIKKWTANNDETNFGSSGPKRKLDDTNIEPNFNDDEIPIHTVKKIKNGTAITTIKTDSKSEGKSVAQPTMTKTTIIRSLNGSIKSTTSQGTSSAEIVIIKDSPQNTGIFKTVSSPGGTSKTEAQIRVLSKDENATSGIVRINSSSSLQTNSIRQRTMSSSPSGVSQLTNTPTMARLASKSISPANSGQISQVQTRIVMTSKENQASTPVKTSAAQTKIISKPSPTKSVNASGGLLQSQARIATTTVQRASPAAQRNSNQLSSGKTIVSRNTRQAKISPAITPEQKIIQLSKSGDLKVTRKVITQPISPNDSSQQQHTLEQSVPRNVMFQGVSISKSSTSEHSQSPILSDSYSHSELQSPTKQLVLCSVGGTLVNQGEADTKNQELDQAEKQQQQQQLQPSNEALQSQISADSQPTPETFPSELNLSADGTHQFIANEDGTPILVTGDDGTIYQVAGKTADGQTILITQGADGEQQFAYVSAEDGEGILGLDSAVTDATAQMLPKQTEAIELATTSGSGETQFIIKQGNETNEGTSRAVEGGDDSMQGLTVQTGESSDSQDNNIPAEVVQADLPSPGGTRRVVLLLPDGTFMMTEMHDDEYQSLQVGAQ